MFTFICSFPSLLRILSSGFLLYFVFALFSLVYCLLVEILVVGVVCLAYGGGGGYVMGGGGGVGLLKRWGRVYLLIWSLSL